MRIAVVRRAYGGVGGAELYTERLISSLGEDGHEVRMDIWPYRRDGSPVSVEDLKGFIEMQDGIPA